MLIMRLITRVTPRSTRYRYRVARFLVRNPREVRRLPRWWRERSAQPFDLRTPWWPYDAVTWVADQLGPDARVFEYGGGGSTLWLEECGATVTVIEHHDGWAQRLAAAVQPRTKVIHRGVEQAGHVTGNAPGYFDSYVAAIDDQPDESFDLVIVDGRARVECVRHAASKVKRGGLLLLDDSNRPRYQEAFDLLAGWERHVFAGLKPSYPQPSQTSVWRRPASDAGYGSVDPGTHTAPAAVIRR